MGRDMTGKKARRLPEIMPENSMTQEMLMGKSLHHLIWMSSNVCIKKPSAPNIALFSENQFAFNYF